MIDDKTMTYLAASTSLRAVRKGEWVFRQGDEGDCMYLVLHGHCKTIIANKDFLEARRELRSKVQVMLSLVDEHISLENELCKMDEAHVEFETKLQLMVKSGKALLEMRQKLKKHSDDLEKLPKYFMVKEYRAGDFFGELALLFDQRRAASIAVTRTTFFLTIHKEDYQNHIKRFEKKQKEQIIEFFKNVHFLRGLSNQSIVKMEYSFVLHKMERAGEVVLKEGASVTHIALVKDGEFEVVKHSVKGLDERIMTFLHKVDVRKRIARQVMMLPGRATVFQTTSKLIPPFERSNDDSYLANREIDVEQLAFNSVSEQLYDIAREQLESQQKQKVSLNVLKKSNIDRYRDIRVSIHGNGFVFGDYEAFTDQAAYQYTLRAVHAGATCYLMEKRDFLKFSRQFSQMGEAVAGSVHEKDMAMMRELTRVVFNRWYTDLLQENMKVVPDLEKDTYGKAEKPERQLALPANAMGAIPDQEAQPEDERAFAPTKQAQSPNVIKKKVQVNLK